MGSSESGGANSRGRGRGRRRERGRQRQKLACGPRSCSSTHAQTNQHAQCAPQPAGSSHCAHSWVHFGLPRRPLAACSERRRCGRRRCSCQRCACRGTGESHRVSARVAVGSGRVAAREPMGESDGKMRGAESRGGCEEGWSRGHTPGERPRRGGRWWRPPRSRSPPSWVPAGSAITRSRAPT